jgi:hypothetical protein
LDGSPVKLKDYISKSDYAKLQQGEMERAQVTYRFDAMLRVLAIAIPQTYNYELFEHITEDTQQEDTEREQERVKTSVSSHHHNGHEAQQPAKQGSAVAVEARPEEPASDVSEDVKKELSERVAALLESGRKVTVVGEVSLASKRGTYIIAGGTTKASTGETRPVAVVVNAKTTIYNHQGDKLPAQAIAELQEGATIVVDGDKNKRGVIEATTLVI